MSANNVVIVKQEGRILFIILNRPEKLNALNGALLDALDQALREAAINDDIRAVVIKGAGHAFSAGMDVSSGQILTIDEDQAMLQSRIQRRRQNV